ncbi:MAG: hypothetical protein ACKVRP_12710 [Bacteroidota bacterium]
MKLDESLKATRFLIPVLIVSLLMSCSASQHAGVTTIKQPPITENNESAWLSYYQDQFDAYKGKVSPPEDQYPKAAHKAYQLAQEDWDSKFGDARLKTILVTGAVVVGLLVVLVVAAPAGK